MFPIGTLFGRNREVFVAFTLLLFNGLYIPQLFIMYSWVALIAVILFAFGAIIYLIAFFVKPNTDVFYFTTILSILIIEIGCALFFVASFDFPNHDCNGLQGAMFDQCWISDFLDWLGLNFFQIYFCTLLSIKIQFGCGFGKCLCSTHASIQNKSLLCIIELVIANACICTFLVLFWDNFENIITAELILYCQIEIILTAVGILFGIFIYCCRANRECNDWLPNFGMFVWFIIGIGIWLFGCISYWDNKSSIYDGILTVGEMYVWSMGSLFVLIELAWLHDVKQRGNGQEHDPLMDNGMVSQGGVSALWDSTY